MKSRQERVDMQSAPEDLVVFSHLRWDFVWQRPQHLISRLARGRRTWFVEEPEMGAPQTLLRCDERGPVRRVCLELEGEARHCGFGDPAASRYLESLLGILPEGSPRVVWLYTPMALPMARQLERQLLVYDVMDDLASFKNAPAELARLHGEALHEADIVFTGGRSLFERVRSKRTGRTYLFASGVEPEHYEQARKLTSPRERHVAGYVGVVDERLDLDLLGTLAAELPDWEIQVVGPVLKIDPGSLPAAPNLRYLGQQPYDRLPSIMAGFDVALMPFALNEATRSISPTKTLEYLAAGLPVVSTPIADVVADFGTVVSICDDAAAFAEACRAVLHQPAEERSAKARPLLKLHHWDTIAERMDAIMSAAKASRGQVRVTAASGSGGFDYMIVGAGFAGSVMAERLASQGAKNVLVVEKRSHIGGNAYDHFDDAGILVHRYGPHIFHTNALDVFQYLSQFAEWRPYEHRVRASVDGRLVPMPINLDTINELYGMNLSSSELEMFFARVAEPVAQCRTSEDVVVGKVGRELYEKFFRNYTRKQWGLDPSDLEATVTARVPTRTSRDDRYFTDRYQAMPRHGYTRLFERMLAHPRIKVMLNTDYREILGLVPARSIIYTGPIDEFFGCCFGRLPYRSLNFRFETHDVESFQEVPVVNYPNEHLYTRVTEFKKLTGQQHAKTTVVYEYPTDEGEPYYPVPRPENAQLFKRYKVLAERARGVHFVGRLASYRYYNMDQVVAQALALSRRLLSATTREAESALLRVAEDVVNRVEDQVREAPAALQAGP
jgi:UDP-galactopyranose mutase